ncbi:MAG: SDR family oxidoreductase [Rhizobiaceae bacterium]|nr:SDR family oxidoreductase [Rhizobiaceae bacterium]
MARQTTVLISGASSGVGLALATMLHGLGYRVVAVARHVKTLNALAANGVDVRSLDIRDRPSLEALVESVQPDVLVCNAAIARFGPLGGAPVSDIDDQVQTNLVAVMDLVRLALPGMRTRKRGHLVILSSQSGHYPSANQTVYATTKAALAMLVSQLRLELLGTPVRVTEIIPGRTRTNIFNDAVGDADEARRRFFDGIQPLEPSDVADAIRYVIEAPAHVNVTRLEILPVGQVPGGLSTVAVE